MIYSLEGVSKRKIGVGLLDAKEGVALHCL